METNMEIWNKLCTVLHNELTGKCDDELNSYIEETQLHKKLYIELSNELYMELDTAISGELTKQ